MKLHRNAALSLIARERLARRVVEVGIFEPGVGERLGDTSLRSIAEGKSRALLRFAADPGTSERLKKVVSAEARCCAFLELDLTEAPGELVLKISSPAGGETAIHKLVRAFRGSRRVERMSAPDDARSIPLSAAARSLRSAAPHLGCVTTRACSLARCALAHSGSTR